MPPVPPPGFEEFAVSALPGLHRFGRQLTGDAAASDDLAQAALLKAWERWDSIRRTDDPGVYVRRIMVNRYLTWWHRRGRREVLTRELPETASSSAEDALVDRHVVLAALDQLTRKQRAVIVLRYFDDMSEAQAAEMLGCSVGTIKSQTSKALARLRGLLAPATGTGTLAAPIRRTR